MMIECVQVTEVNTLPAALVMWEPTLPATLVTSEPTLARAEVASEKIEPPGDLI
jgi:hypothetical protein